MQYSRRLNDCELKLEQMNIRLLIYRPSVRCLRYKLSFMARGRTAICSPLYFQPIRTEIYELSLALTQNRTGSWGLHFLYMYLYCKQ